MQTRLRGRKFDGCKILGDGIHMTLGFRIGLRQNLTHAPRLGIGFKHFGIAVLGNQQMGLPSMIKNIHVVGRDLGGFVQDVGSLLRAIFRQLDDAQPHQRARIFGVRNGFLPH